jgi:hypothetical protein
MTGYVFRKSDVNALIEEYAQSVLTLPDRMSGLM